jgi:RHS repeat-associated protein
MEEYVAEQKTPVEPGVESQRVPYMQESEARIVGQASGTKEILFFHNDHLGTPIVVTDIDGMVVSKHRYSPFGEELAPEGSNSHTHRFTGHERDNETGLDYMMARYYGAEMGRFLSPDPVLGTPGNPQSWNRYAYVLNNPVKLVDPLGLYSVTGPAADEFNDLTSAAIGFGVNADENGNMQRPAGPPTAENQAAADAFDAASTADFTINAVESSAAIVDNYNATTVAPSHISALPAAVPGSAPEAVTRGEVVRTRKEIKVAYCV